jgi:DNA gyrase subunit A
VLLISDGGTLVRTRGRKSARRPQHPGVTLIRLSKDEKLQAVERMDASIDGDELDRRRGRAGNCRARAPRWMPIHRALRHHDDNAGTAGVVVSESI